MPADASGNMPTGHSGTVSFGRSDSRAVPPANYTFERTEKEVHTFGGRKLRTTGTQTIPVMDTLDNSILGTWTIYVM